MRNIDIKIQNLKTIVSGEPVIVCNNSDYIITFAFDEDWDTYDVKTARFVYTRGGHIQSQDIVFTGNICQVPVFYDITDVFVGVFAGDIHTTTPAKIYCMKSILDYDGPPEEPDPDVYAQIMELINSGQLQGPAGDSGATYTPEVSGDGELSWTNDRGLDNPEPVNIRGPQGKDGLPGPQGPPGDNTAALEAAEVAIDAAANANAAADAALALEPAVEQLKNDLTALQTAKMDRYSIKPVMDSVATPHTQYYLGEQTAVEIVLPDTAEVGQIISVSWYNGITAATLSITGTMLDFDFAPSANARSEINALWDGTYWAVIGNEMAVVADA